MKSNDLCYKTAAELVALIRAKQLSPVEVTQAALERAEQLQPRLNAFITICSDQAIAAAKAAEVAVIRGDALGPLHGVPMTVKDLVNTRGVRTTFGSLVFAHNVPATDATAVDRLKSAGAILIGKTTTPEFGHKPFTEAPLFGRTPNVWSLERTSGGSSGGAAVATAAGIAPLAVSTDGGGSTRIPAACNGVVGVKQTLGLVPHDLAPDAFGNFAYIDPTARTVMDCALMLDAMAGPHASDPHSLYLYAKGFAAAARGEGDLAGIRVGWRPFMGNTAIDPQVYALCQSAVQVFGDFNADIVELTDEFEPAEPVFQVLWCSLLNARYRQYVEHYRDRMSQTLLRYMDEGRQTTGEAILQAMFARTAIYRKIQLWFTSVDIVVTPTLARTALAIDHDPFEAITINGKPVGTVRQAWYPYTHPFNMSGHPAITLPAGFHPDGLPVAIQLVGRHNAETLLLKAAALFELTRPWTQYRPLPPEIA